MAVDKVRVSGVDVASLHVDHVRDELGRRHHRVAKELDDGRVELVPEGGIALEDFL